MRHVGSRSHESPSTEAHGPKAPDSYFIFLITMSAFVFNVLCPVQTPDALLRKGLSTLITEIRLKLAG
eukprot:1136935-Pelagomonas_calceolata.AAC.5